MKARFESTCPRCDKAIRTGQEISRRGGVYAHTTCSSACNDPEYLRGVAEVSQIQAISQPGSELREQLYREMELAAYNRGEDY